MKKRNCFIGQSGGPTVAINASLAGIIHECIKSQKFDHVYGMVNGIMGLLESRYMDLGELFNDSQALEQLKHFKDKDLIKVITGIRRCGKSTLFDLYNEFLLNSGIEKQQIIRINLEDPIYYELDSYLKLYNYVLNKIDSSKKTYVFIDEVQVVPEFQKACDGLYLNKNIDLYITGSNANLLSGELATLLSGRYIEIKMLPLSFKEFVSANNNDDNIDRLFQKYISWGSFPYVLNFDNIDDVDKYIKGIYDSIILKDIMARRKFPDMLMLQSVVSFLLDNIGNITSTNKIKDTLVSNGRTISIHRKIECQNRKM